jgi:Regulated-SNARE-like domain
MPPLLTQVARLSDGMPLVATITASPGSPVSNKDQQEAKDILRSLTHQYVVVVVVPILREAFFHICLYQALIFPIFFSFTYRSPGKLSIVSGNHVFYYMVRESLCYLTMTENSYPKRMAFLYLDEVADAVLSELMNEFQENVSRSNALVVVHLSSDVHNFFNFQCFNVSVVVTNETNSGGHRLIRQPVHFASFITIPSFSVYNVNTETLVAALTRITIQNCKKI